MNTNKSIGREYSCKDFADAFFELKKSIGFSYMQIAVKAKLSDTYLVNIVNRKNLAPNSKNIKKIAKALKVEPEYFYEFRLRKLINILDSNRKYLDPVLKELYGQEKKIYTHTAKSRITKAREARI